MPEKISIIITTYSTDSLYTQACLESVRLWKNDHHEVIVVAHDESPLLRALLESYFADGLIDKLVFAVSGHGHTRGFNLGMRYASGATIFNIGNDILIGPSLIDYCAWDLLHDSQLGMIGWHWYGEGTFWRDGRIYSYSLRTPENPGLDPQHEHNIRNAKWFTGRYFGGIGGPYWLNVCNTSFFGIEQQLLRRIGGFSREYQHYWADDFLSYAVLDQGLDVRHFDKCFRSKPYFHEFQYENIDASDRRRHDDTLEYHGAFLDSIRLIDGGMSNEESIYLHLLAKAVPEESVVTNIGVWLGASAIILLDALKFKRISFNFIDCFDIPGISAMSAQPPASCNEFKQNIQQYISKKHQINIVRSNSLILNAIPKSDFVFVDAGHTKECIAHDSCLAQTALTDDGIAVFHDYGQPLWPDVKPVLDERFPKLEVYKTMAAYRKVGLHRESFEW